MRLERRARRPSAGEALAARDLGEGPGDPLRYVTLAVLRREHFGAGGDRWSRP
jgi:hypothetical protein